MSETERETQVRTHSGPGIPVVISLVCMLVTACGPAPGYQPDSFASPRRGEYEPASASCVGSGCGAEAIAGANAVDHSGSGAPTPTAEPDSGTGAGGSAGAPFPFAFDDGSGGAPPPPTPAPLTPAPAATCDDSCRFARNGECDDGRAGSDTDLCAPGSDCADCGG